MSKKQQQTKFVTKDILKSSIIGAFQKLSPTYMVKNPVMFVVEVGFVLTLLMTIVPVSYTHLGRITVTCKRFGCRYFGF